MESSTTFLQNPGNEFYSTTDKHTQTGAECVYAHRHASELHGQNGGIKVIKSIYCWFHQLLFV